ncbi:MAG: hypothetical protein AB8G77_01635 [Rhodothermales bacterium]
MNKISRSTFLKISALGLVGAAKPSDLFSLTPNQIDVVQDDVLLKKVINSSDLAVERYLGYSYEGIRYYRPLSDAFATYSASYCHPDSRYHKSQDVLARMDDILSRLLVLQYPNGTLDSGGNRQSPPDTAFYLENMCPAATVLKQADIGETKDVQDKLNEFLQRAGEGIRTGGVHTPNHRWVVCAILARLYSLFGDEKYVHRLDEWLAEGIYLNEDGNYPERSRNYSIVEGQSLITVGRLLNRHELFEVVKKNLESNYYYMEPNGDLITLDSRRQDQNYTVPIARYYFLYKYLANHYSDAFFAAIAKEIEGFAGFDRFVLSKLIVFMEEPDLLTEIPANQPLPVNYVKELPASGLVRIRRGDTTASIFGGNDKPLTIASGRSNNPTFFTFRKGAAILHSARLSTAFFNTGYVRSDGVIKNGNEYYLSERKEAYYYQPMPADIRNASGDYELSESVDDRFWSKMDFENRPKDTIALESSIKITEENGSFSMDVEVGGSRDVSVVIAFCFNKGGKLEGVTPAGKEDDYFLESGTAKYTFGDDMIEIGPGKHEHNSLRGLDGEVYSTHFGTIKGQGMHVYITGITPFKHSLTIK